MDVVVVGAAIQDFTSYAPRIPNPGETVLGSSFAFSFGGKAANQAVMAARLGANTAVISKVGNDAFGDAILSNFRANGVDVDNVGISNDVNTGTCSIVVDQFGQSRLVGVMGAVSLLSVDDVRRAQSKIGNAKVLVCTLEVDPMVSTEALRIAKSRQVTTIFNPSPRFLPNGALHDDSYKISDVICVNKDEAKWLTGMHLEADDDVNGALVWFLDRGAKCVVITLGESGCVFATSLEKRPVRVQAPKVNVVDATGAGDALIGSLAYFTSCCELSLEKRLQRACQIAATSVQSQGAQASYPKREQLSNDLLGFT